MRALVVGASAGLIVGLTTYWLARTLAGRDPIRIDPPSPRPGMLASASSRPLEAEPATSALPDADVS